MTPVITIVTPRHNRDDLPRLDMTNLRKPDLNGPGLEEAEDAAARANREREEWVDMMEQFHGIRRP
jgi:hypothetical protein